MEADYVLEIRAHSYQNSGHSDSSVPGSLCDPLGDDCDNRFTFCLRNAGTDEDDDATNCPLGRYSSSEIVGGDDFIFGSSQIASGVPNPMTFSGNFWPVSLIYSIL